MLTDRERKIVRMLPGGRSDKAIAHTLRISTKMVGTQCATILRTLGTGSLADLVRYTIRNKLMVP